MPVTDMPSAEVPVSVGLMRSLILDQRPDLAGESVVPLAEGWDNISFRIGEHLVARLPRREVAARLVENEQRWLPELEPLLPLPIPVPRFFGEPGRGYPWRWSICDYLPGAPAALAPPRDRTRAAETVGSFLGALHRGAPADAPENPFRGGPLEERDEVVRRRLDQVSDLGWLDKARALSIWEAAAAAPVFPGPPVWIHGDLHPNNILVADGAISAVVDFGDITGGDPATDLAVAWMMFDIATHPVLRASHGGVDEPAWRRARGWALHLGVTFLAGSADNEVMGRIGRGTIERVLAESIVQTKP